MALTMREQEPSRTAPDADEIDAMARAVLRALPPPFAAYLSDIVLTVEEFADEATLTEMGIADPFELTGLYEGVPVGDKSIWGVRPAADRIRLFRRALLDEWCDRPVALDALIAEVVIHEVGHHFGLSDDDMHAIDGETP